LKLPQRLQTVRVLQPVRTEVEIRQLRAGIEVVYPLQRVAADIERRERSKPTAAPVEVQLAFL
jgi:hypothetical protein